MQPVFPYRPESYPPRGRIWPQFGDDVLEETLSMSEGARQSLNRKKQDMTDWHKDNLVHHGLAHPRPPMEEVAWPDELYDRPPSEPARAPQEPAGPQEELPFHLHETQPDPPAPASIQRGVVNAPRPSGIHYGDDNLPYTTPDYPMARQRGSVQEDLASSGFPGSQTAPLRARDSFRMQPDRPGLATQATPQYPRSMPVDDLGNVDFQDQLELKRPADIKTERNVKFKPEPLKSKVKQEPGISHRGPGSTQPPPLAPDDEDLQTLRVNFNNNEDMSYWENQASANEMKAQLNLRFPQLSGNWQFKSRPQLVSYIRGLVRKNQWVQGSEPAERTRSRSPAPAPEDDDVQVSGVSWDQNADPAYWQEQSSNYIRQQLTAKFPNKRTEFAFFKKRDQYIRYITDLIRKKQYP